MGDLSGERPWILQIAARIASICEPPLPSRPERKHAAHRVAHGSKPARFRRLLAD